MVLYLVSAVQFKQFMFGVPHRVANRDRARERVAQGHCVTKLRGWGCWVTKSDGSVDGVRAVRRVQVLPGPPHAVDLGMVKVEPMVVSMKNT